MSSTILFKFPERNNMPAVDVTWYDGLDNIPAVPENFGSSDVDPNIPTVAGGKLQLMKLNPGKEIYSKTLTFKGGSHGSTLSVIPDQIAKDMNPKLPEYEKVRLTITKTSCWLARVKKRPVRRSPLLVR